MFNKEEKIKEISIHDDTQICGFFGDFRWLSNFEPCEVTYEGLMYQSSEAAYQAAKTLDQEIRKQFTNITAGQSKKKGRALEDTEDFREDWYDCRLSVMYDIVMAKFTQNSDLKQKLLDTGNVYLEETNYWQDKTYGVCVGEGKNYLGIILMKVRSELKK